MILPNAEKAIVERDKIVDYLLNAAHPDNGGKATFFESLGFRRSKPELLEGVAEVGMPGRSDEGHDIAARPEICYRRAN